jgi:hypothetical protein
LAFAQQQGHLFFVFFVFHARSGCLQQRENLLQDISDLHEEIGNEEEVGSVNEIDGPVIEIDRNYNLACESGLRYPSLQAMFDRKSLTCRISVCMDHFVDSCFILTRHVRCSDRVSMHCTAGPGKAPIGQ